MDAGRGARVAPAPRVRLDRPRDHDIVGYGNQHGEDDLSAAELVRQLEATRDETLRYFTLGAADLERTYGPGKWSVRYLLHHLADSETVLFDRIKRTLSEPRPELLVYDQDAWAKALDYSRLPLGMSSRIYESVREAHIHYAELYYEERGHLEFVHSVTGVRTLKQEFDKVAAHNAHHLAQIRTALSSGATR